MNTSKRRVFLGFLIAPGTPALGLYLINLIFVSRQEAALAGIIFVIMGYAVAVAIGIPTYMLARRKGTLGLSACLGLGALVGLIAYILIFGIWGLVSYQSAPEHAITLIRNSVKTGMVAVGYATIAGWLFWLIALRQHRA